MENRIIIILILLIKFSNLFSQEFIYKDIADLLVRNDSLYGNVYFIKANNRYVALEYSNEKHLRGFYYDEFFVIDSFNMKKLEINYDSIFLNIPINKRQDSVYSDESHINDSIDKEETPFNDSLNSIINKLLYADHRNTIVLNYQYSLLKNSSRNKLKEKDIDRKRKKSLIINSIYEGKSFYVILCYIQYLDSHDVKIRVSELLYK